MHRLKVRNNALNNLKKQFDENLKNVRIIHYSCESFYFIQDGHTPRVTSIAIKNCTTWTVDSFSIHKIAEIKWCLDNINSRYDELELEMLENYAQFLNENKHCIWIHWNMRDINYWFRAIEHRHNVLNHGEKDIFVIREEDKIDLAKLLIDIYSDRYISHWDKWRLSELIKKNNISTNNYLDWWEEANAFKNGEYIKLHQSTLKKTDIIKELIDKILNGTLKHNAKFWDIYWLTPQSIFRIFRETWRWAIILSIVSFIIWSLIKI